MKKNEPAVTRMPCTCKEGCFLYDEPVLAECCLGKDMIVEGYFVDKNGLRCYIATFLDEEYEQRWKEAGGFSSHMMIFKGRKS